MCFLSGDEWLDIFSVCGVEGGGFMIGICVLFVILEEGLDYRVGNIFWSGNMSRVVVFVMLVARSFLINRFVFRELEVFCG